MVGSQEYLDQPAVSKGLETKDTLYLKGEPRPPKLPGVTSQRSDPKPSQPPEQLRLFNINLYCHSEERVAFLARGNC